MMQLNLPTSGVIDADHPYVLTAQCDPALQGQPAEVTVRLQRRGDAESIISTVTADIPPDGRLAIRLDAGRLGEGEYTGEATLATPQGTVQRDFGCYRMPAVLELPFPFAVYAVPQTDPDAWNEELAAVRATGINLICQHMGDPRGQAPYLDIAARHGVRFIPSDNLGRADIPAREELLARMNLPTDAGPKAGFCFNQPIVRAGATAAFEAHLRAYRAHAGYSGLAYYGDDLFMDVHPDGDQLGITCYCPYCRQDFAARTGLEAPATTVFREGIVPADDPWLRWMRYRCGEVFGGFIRTLEDARRAADPQTRMGMVHGFPQQPFSYVATGIYGPLSQPTSVVSSYAYPYLRSPRADLIGHYEIGRMGNRGKDVWMLGAFNSNRTLFPAWQVYQNYWNMLAAGYRFIGFFSWWDIAHARERGEHDRVQEEIDALARCGDHAAWVLPVAKYWEPPAAPFAALYSFTTEAFDYAPVNRGYRHTERVLDTLREALRRQVPLEVICEEEVLDGILDRYQALCLRDARALPEPVVRKIEEYIAGGGLVLKESELHSYYFGWPKLPVRGAHEMSPESMIAVLRDRCAPSATVDSDDVTVRRLDAGQVRYFVFVNNYTDRYWGNHFRYDSPEANHRFVEQFVRDEAVTATVRFADAGYSLYDLATGEALGSTSEPLALALGPSWGRALAALPCRTAAMRITCDDQVAAGEELRLAIEVCDETGQRIDGAFTARVTVTTLGGRTLACSGSVGLPAGAGEFTVPIGGNDEPGAWTVIVEGGFPRQVIARKVTVSRPAAPAGSIDVITVLAADRGVTACMSSPATR